MKPLSPTMREKKRYLLLKGNNLKENVEKAIFEGIGTIGMARVCLKWINFYKEFAIISINREMLDSVRASFAIWPESIEVKKVSGTLKSLKEKRR